MQPCTHARCPAMVPQLTFGSTCIASVLRLYSVYVYAVADDANWNHVAVTIWSSVETNTGIICSCLPVMKALITHLFPRFFSSQGRSHGTDRIQSHRGGHGYQSRAEFGQTISGRHRGMMNQTDVHGGVPPEFVEIDLMNTSPKDITVLTVVQQELEEKNQDDTSRSEHGSTRHLVLRDS